MKIKLGIIGPLDTVEKIKNVAKEFENKIQVIECYYYDKKETSELLKIYVDQVDVFLFSGFAPYLIAENTTLIKKPYIYIPITGTSIYLAFWQMQEQNMNSRKISFDTISKAAIEEVVKELNIKVEGLYVKSYTNDIDYSELVDYHSNLWEAKKISTAITCLSKVYEELKKMGVPVIKLYPTVNLIREYIEKAIYIGDAEKIQATQIAVQIVKIMNKDLKSEYNFLTLKNQLEKTLIHYTQNCLGYFFSYGRDEYLIFSNRGAIKAQWENNELQKNLLDSKIDLRVSSGIGFGNSAYAAETNARIALTFAINESNNCSYMVDENGNISGPIGGDNENMSYDLMVTDENIQKMAKEIKISASYLSKIKSIIIKTKTNRMNAEDFSNYLGISIRSGNRILRRIKEAGYAKAIAQKNVSKVGRPAIIYEILI